MHRLSPLDQIKREGYALVPLPKQNLIENILNGFTRFLDEPFEKRLQWTFQISEGHDAEVGFLPRNKPVNTMTGLAYDFKDVFHYQPTLSSRLEERRVDITSYRDWLRDLDELYRSVEMMGKDFLGQLLDAYKVNLSDQKTAGMFQGGHALRLIRYHMREREGGVIGLGHYDESLFTFNLMESVPGLRVGPAERPVLIKKSKNDCMVYPGKKVESLTHGSIKALWHDIVDAGIASDPQQQRMSVVFFMDQP